MGAPFGAQGLRAMLRPYMMMANVGLRVTLTLNPHPQKPEGAAPKAFVVCHGFVAMTRKDPPFKTKGGAPGEPFEGRFGRNDSFVVWVTL